MYMMLNKLYVFTYLVFVSPYMYLQTRKLNRYTYTYIKINYSKLYYILQRLETNGNPVSERSIHLCELVLHYSMLHDRQPEYPRMQKFTLNLYCFKDEQTHQIL